MFNENIVLERGFPPHIVRQQRNENKKSVTSVTNNRHWRELRCKSIWSSMQTLFETDIDLYYKLTDYVDGIYQRFSDDELETLRKYTFFDSENKIDEFTAVVIQSTNNRNMEQRL